MSTFRRACFLVGAVASMARPSQLLLIVVVALLGVGIGRARGGEADPATIAAGLAVLLPLAASIHLANEYADHETDARTTRTPFSGGSGTLGRTGLPRSLALLGARGAAVAGFAGAITAVAAGRMPLEALGILVAGTAGGWAYSVGPAPLAWRGLGEVTNAFLGAMLLPIYGVVLTGAGVDFPVIVALAPLMFVATANLLATTWPDRAADAEVGKGTLATRWPAGRLRATYAALVGVALVLLVAQAPSLLPAAVVVAGLSAVPLGVVAFASYTRTESPAATVWTMVWLIVAQALAWWTVAS